MPQYPQILYWKWDEEILKDHNLEVKTKDILARSGFDMIYISLHWFDRPFHDSAIVQAIERCEKIIRGAGRKLMVDIDVRNEGKTFFAHNPKDRTYLTTYMEIQLDEQGRGSRILESIPAERWNRRETSEVELILNGWIVESGVGGSVDLSPISTTLIRKDVGIQEVQVDAGRDYAHARAVVCPAYPHVLPDLFAESLYEHFEGMFQSVSHIPLAGVGVDEWGYSPLLKENEEGFYLEHLPFSWKMSEEYCRQTGRRLEDDLVFFKYTGDSADGPSRQIDAINAYIRVIRTKMAENEAWFYRTGKVYFGPDTFIAAHPTWWGNAVDLSMEIPYNGLNWWEVKRDYAQTDEEVIMPIRLAMARKCGGPVWYNMFYSAFTRRIETYYQETWLNAQFGGRTHQLGYECPNETGVYEMCQPGGLENIWLMEEKIAKLNDFQKSQPDSRVLVVFGMQAVTNWAFTENKSLYWKDNSHPYMRQTLKFANDLVGAGYLCDLVPSSEIVNGSLKRAGDKAIYGIQSYDTVIYLYPECIHPLELNFLRDFNSANTRLILIGNCRYDIRGNNAAEAFGMVTTGIKDYFGDMPEHSSVTDRLKVWKIAGNRFLNGCVYQDGSLIFTAEGLAPIGNPLEVDVWHRGHHIEFSGADFLALDLNTEGYVKRLGYGEAYSLRINGIAIELNACSDQD